MYYLNFDQVEGVVTLGVLAMLGGISLARQRVIAKGLGVLAVGFLATAGTGLYYYYGIKRQNFEASAAGFSSRAEMLEAKRYGCDDESSWDSYKNGVKIWCSLEN